MDKAGRMVEPVAIFEIENQRLRGIAIMKKRAGAVEAEGFGMAATAQGALSGINLEGKAAALAQRAVDKGDLLPAGGA